MKKQWLCRAFGMFVLVSGAAVAAAPAEQRFEAENVLVNSDAIQPNTSRKGIWNLWSTDKDAAKKWSEGVVIQGNAVMADCKPGENMPVLKFRIPVTEAGTYNLNIAVGRSVGVSLDGGKTFFRYSGNGPLIRARKVGAGEAIEVEIAGNYAHPEGAGSPYIDYFTLVPVASVELIKNGGFETAESGKTPACWGFWAREEAVGSSAVAADAARSGKRAVRIVAKGGKDWAFTASGTAVKPGETFEATCYAKNNAEKAPDIELQVSAYGNGKLVSFSMTSRKLDKLTGDWQEYRLKFTVPEGVDHISLRLVGGGACDILADDFSLVPATPDAASAVKPLLKPVLPKSIGTRKVNGFAAARVEEKFDRGLVALPLDKGEVYLSWRLLAGDAPGIGFDVFSVLGGKEAKLNAAPVVQTTDFTVAAPVEGAHYAVRPSAGFQGVAGTAAVTANPEERNPFFLYKLSDPRAMVNKVGVGDLDGDGKFDFVVRYGNANVDPWYLFWKPSKQPFTLEAVSSDGKRLWTKDLGWNIESGIWYSPYVVFDVNGDGRAEVILKAADPGAGDLREKEGEDAGKVMSGAEYLMVLDGMTGREIARAPWPDRRHFEGQQMAYNYFSRNQIAIAYLDGKTPCIVALRGTYGLMLAEAWQLKDGKLEALWSYNSSEHGREFHGQGAHTTRAIDLDGDGRDELVLGGAVLDDDGSPLWSTGHGHPDHVFVTDITPKNPGLEIVTVYETPCKAKGGFTCADAKTGKVIWELDKPSTHIHYGYAGDIDARYRGWEVGGSDTTGGDDKQATLSRHYSPDGELLAFGEEAPFHGTEHFAYWDADLQREHIAPVLTDFGGGPCGGMYAGKFLIQADILGDWREEILTAQRGELRIYCTTVPAMDRRVCLMQDPDYRLTVADNAMGYVFDPALTYLPTSVSPNLNLTFLNGKDSAQLRIVVSAPLNTGLKGTLKLSSDRQVKFGRNEIPVDLQPGGLETFEIPVERPFPLNAVIRGVLTLDGGTVLRGQVPTGIRTLGSIKLSGILTEAEDFTGQTGGTVKIRSDKSGVHGKCFSHWDHAGHAVTWKLKVPESGKYQLALRYAGTDDAVRRVIVGGHDYGAFSLPGTGGFGDGSADWEMFKVGRDGGQLILPLEKGETELQLVNVSGSMNLDCIELVPVP